VSSPTIHSLLPPSATRLERAAGQVATPSIDVTALRGLGDSTRVPALVLPWLAWAASTDGWEEAITEESRRELVRRSVEIHQRKGTAGAIRRVLGAIGASIELTEWQRTGGTPYTFTLTIRAGSSASSAGVGLIGLELYARIRRMVNAVKNERSHYEMNVGARFGQALRFAAVLNAGQVSRIALDALPVQPAGIDASLHAAAAVEAASIVHISMELS